jgi:hypothetical protein
MWKLAVAILLAVAVWFLLERSDGPLNGSANTGIGTGQPTGGGGIPQPGANPPPTANITTGHPDASITTGPKNSSPIGK